MYFFSHIQSLETDDDSYPTKSSTAVNMAFIAVGNEAVRMFSLNGPSSLSLKIHDQIKVGDILDVEETVDSSVAVVSRKKYCI